MEATKPKAERMWQKLKGEKKTEFVISHTIYSYHMAVAAAKQTNLSSHAVHLQDQA
jgi:hypothetical protein